jgi:hypothetical protein
MGRRRDANSTKLPVPAGDSEEPPAHALLNVLELRAAPTKSPPYT